MSISPSQHGKPTPPFKQRLTGKCDDCGENVDVETTRRWEGGLNASIPWVCFACQQKHRAASPWRPPWER